MDLTKKQRAQLWNEIRRKTGLTIKELCDKYNIPRSACTNWHNAGASKKYVPLLLNVYKETSGKDFVPVSRSIYAQTTTTPAKVEIKQVAVTKQETKKESVVMFMGDPDSIAKLVKGLL